MSTSRSPAYLVTVRGPHTSERVDSRPVRKPAGLFIAANRGCSPSHPSVCATRRVFADARRDARRTGSPAAP